MGAREEAGEVVAADGTGGPIGRAGPALVVPEDGAVGGERADDLRGHDPAVGFGGDRAEHVHGHHEVEGGRGEGQAGAVGLGHRTGGEAEAEDPEVDADAPQGQGGQGLTPAAAEVEGPAHRSSEVVEELAGPLVTLLVHGLVGRIAGTGGRCGHRFCSASVVGDPGEEEVVLAVGPAAGDLVAVAR